MYLFEKFSWEHLTESMEPRSHTGHMTGEAGGYSFPVSPDLEIKSESQSLPLDEPASHSPTHADSLYAFDEVYIDVRASFQEDMRGLITFGFVSFAIIINMLAFYVGIIYPIKTFMFGNLHSESGDF